MFGRRKLISGFKVMSFLVLCTALTFNTGCQNTDADEECQQYQQIRLAITCRCHFHWIRPALLFYIPLKHNGIVSYFQRRNCYSVHNSVNACRHAVLSADFRNVVSGTAAGTFNDRTDYLSGLPGHAKESTRASEADNPCRIPIGGCWRKKRSTRLHFNAVL